KTRIRLVLIESANHVIPIGPGIRARLVLVITVGVGEMDRVQPMPCPAFSIARRIQQTVHLLLVSSRTSIGNESLNVFRARRQRNQIKAQPPNQSPPIRLHRGRKLLLFELSTDEKHDRLSRPVLILTLPQRLTRCALAT